MPDPIGGNFWTVTYVANGVTTVAEAVDIDTEDGDSTFHASIDAATTSGATSVQLTKSA